MKYILRNFDFLSVWGLAKDLEGSNLYKDLNFIQTYADMGK